jgi:ferredoxin
MRALERHEINDEKCIRCGGCRSVCPVGAVEVH